MKAIHLNAANVKHNSVYYQIFLITNNQTAWELQITITIQ